MKFNIQIMSRYESIITDAKDISEECILISINSIDEKHHKFRNSKIKEVLYLDFDDITPLFIEKGSKCTLMTTEQTIQIKEFIDKYKNNINDIKIHCTAGISRSGAVGCIIAKYLNGDDLYLFESGKYLPNEWVYKLMSETFNLNYDIAEFENKLEISGKKCSKHLEKHGGFGLTLENIF